MRNYPETLHEWLDYWRELYYKPTVKASTYDISYYNLQIIKRYLPNCFLAEIEPEDCQRFLNDLYTGGFAKATIKKLNSLLRQALSWAVKSRLMERNPAEDMTIPKAGTKKVLALTQGEQRILEIFCNDTRYGDYMIFLLYTGLRVGELINLKWQDYNVADGVIHIRSSKTESGVRAIPLIEKAKKILEAQVKLKGDNYIFHTVNKKPLTYGCMKKCYEQLREKTGFMDFTNHVCRHTFATRLIEKGASPKSVAALLGHKKVAFALDIYIDMEKQELKKEIFLLDEKSAVKRTMHMRPRLSIENSQTVPLPDNLSGSDAKLRGGL
ncbi:MAG: tyrosine-type recombinase/integrase [Angelakisella sp.]